jgi:hypothetical protein
MGFLATGSHLRRFFLAFGTIEPTFTRGSGSSLYARLADGTGEPTQI